MTQFKNPFGQNIFDHKYATFEGQTWAEKAEDIVTDVTHATLDVADKQALRTAITDFKFLPGGRYIYYAGRRARFFNNCYLLKGEIDTREEWGNLAKRSSDCLMSGGGIGVDYSVFRPAGAPLGRTGGTASGPIPLMHSINEIGRNVMQGGSRRSAIYASLNWKHGDIGQFLRVKDWENIEHTPGLTFKEIKEMDFNAAAPLDMTNISINYDNEFLEELYGLEFDEILSIYEDGGIDMVVSLPIATLPEVFIKNVEMAMRNGEPGFSFNFFDQVEETLRNAPVTGDTMVLTDEGYRPVYCLVDVPYRIWTGKQWANDVVFKKTKTDSELVKVVLSNGRSITCSPEHPFITKEYEGKGAKKKVTTHRVPAEDLIEGTKISSDHVPSKIRGTNDKSYGLGFVYGDGSINAGRGEISVHSASKNEAYACTVVALGAHVVSNPDRAYFKYDVESKEDLLSSVATYWDNNDKASFIAGYFDADGCYTSNLLRLASSNIDGLYTVQLMLSELGIKSTVRLDGTSGYKASSPSYTLTVLRSSFADFVRAIPTKRILIDDDSEPYRESEIRVVSVEQLDHVEDVYCCDVGVEEHSFMAEGVIISNCTEVTSADDSDVCNLGSINMGNVTTLEEFRTLVALGSKFLVCGTMEADLPYAKVADVRKKNRRLGLGLMGVHEWLLKRGYKYEMNDELREWLQVYKEESVYAANLLCDLLGISRPRAYRAIAPTGTIGILAGTTTGIEPVYAVAYKRRYLVGASDWKYEYVIDNTAKLLIEEGVNPDDIETAAEMALDPERRIKFQADVQDYVDMAISSTLNLPEWGSKVNCIGKVHEMAETVAKYAPRLRGLTFYPDGSRGGQPLTLCPYEEAVGQEGVVYEDNTDCAGGICGL